MKHWARAKGSSWYMPEALSLYMMLRSVKATGCTVMELMIPRNSIAKYRLPKMLPRSCAVDLHICQITAHHAAADVGGIHQ